MQKKTERARTTEGKGREGVVTEMMTILGATASVVFEYDEVNCHAYTAYSSRSP